MLVSICVATYRRPESLKVLLDSLNQLEFKVLETPEIEVVVVENDSEPHSRSYCQVLNENSPWLIRHVLEPRRGLSHVRNRAIESIDPSSDFLVFIDDDEVAEPQWLEVLLKTQAEYSADVVTGPVLREFQVQPPSWIESANLLPIMRRATGTEVPVAFTCNVLLSTQILENVANRFDPRFSLSGGEDTHFFMRIYRQGHRIVWCDDAIVHESMPKTRMTMKWFLMRNYRNYSSHSFCEKDLDAWYKVFPHRCLTGTTRMTLGFVGFWVGLPLFFFRQSIVVNALMQMARGAGTLSGLIGIQYQEYRNVHTA